MPGCLPLIAAILMQKFPGSVKLTCPENQCHILKRLDHWKHKDIGNQGYTYSLESNQVQGSVSQCSVLQYSAMQQRKETRNTEL